MTDSMSPYESSASKEIQAWREPGKPGLLARIGGAINMPFEKGAELVMKIPGVEGVIEQTVGGLVSMLNDAAQWSVRPEAIYKDYQKAGHNIQKREDILALDLEDIDKTIGWLAAKYKSLAAIEGAGTGLVGLPGIPADIVALLSLNLRAIGEYATYCGFDVSLQQERLIAMQLLGMSSSTTDAGKQVFMANLIKISKDVAKKKTWKQLEKHAFVGTIRKLAESLGVRLTKAKMAQIVPAAGAIVGGGFNAYYTNKVCTAAYFLYRERFLAGKYGAEVFGQGNTDDPELQAGQEWWPSEDAPE